MGGDLGWGVVVGVGMDSGTKGAKCENRRLELAALF